MTPTPEYSGPERRKHRKHGDEPVTNDDEPGTNDDEPVTNGDEPVTNDDLDEALAEHTAQERKFATELYAGIMGAFPDGTEKHRQAHDGISLQVMVESSKELNAMGNER